MFLCYICGPYIQLMDKSREPTIQRVTIAGAVVNLILCVFKLLSGMIGRSSAMLADGVHSLSDLVSDVVVVVMVRISSRERDKGHDYGHGKFETLATLCVSVLLLVVGAKLMAGAIGSICSVARGDVLEAPGIVAFWAAVVSILVKEILFHWTNCVGKKVDSSAMIANAWHHRSDALSSIGSVLGIGGAILLGGKWTILDPVVGCIISVILIVVAVKMSIPAIEELTEASLPDDVEDRIVSIINAVPGVDGAHELKTRRNGPNIIIDVHLEVNPQMTVLEAHDITILVEKALRAEYGSDTQVSIHIEPDGECE